MSEFNLGIDEKNEGVIFGEGVSVYEFVEKGRERLNGVEVLKKGFNLRILVLVVLVWKILKDEVEESDIVGWNLNFFFNDNLELNGEVEFDIMKGFFVVKKFVLKFIVIWLKLKEKEKNNLDFIVEDDE